MRIPTALKHLRSLHEAEVETGNMKEARAIEVAVEALEKAKSGVVKKSLTTSEIVTVDTMFLRDISELSALRAPEEVSRRRELRMRALAILDGTAR